MDERVLERIVARSLSTIKQSGMIALSIGGVFTATLFWVILRALFGKIEGVLHFPLLCMAASVTIVPLALIALPIASRYVHHRSNTTPPPLVEFFQHHWKSLLIIFGGALATVIIELALTVVVALWCGFESLPVVGTALYIISSWVPTLIILLMATTLTISSLLLVSLSAALAQTAFIEHKTIWFDMTRRLRQGWVCRVKLILLGTLPSALLFAVATSWTMKGAPQNVEFCASLFRVAAFSVVGAPLFIFFVHMAVESDRYVQYLISRRGK